MKGEINNSIDPQKTISGVLGHTFRHPVESLILRWNWKAAVLSALLRSPIFFTAYLAQKQGLWIAFGAMLAQFFFRTLFGGVNGAIIQSFSKVEPAWQAVVTIPLVLAAFSHLIEFVVQTGFDSLTGTHGKGKAILVSIIISIISAVFNLFAMRRGALLVKDESEQSLWRDLKRMPWLAFEFLAFPLVWTVRRTKKKINTLNQHLSQNPDLANREL
jgi:hypothetical protein